MTKIPLKVSKLNPNATLPTYANPGDSGFDLAACDEAIIYAQEVVLIDTGLAFEIPEGYEIQIRSRSGLALQGIIVPNSPATIDAGYRGEVKVMLRNEGSEAFVFRVGDRLAQGVLAETTQAEFIEVPIGDLSASVRGENGFGSSGISTPVEVAPDKVASEKQVAPEVEEVPISIEVPVVESPAPEIQVAPEKVEASVEVAPEIEAPIV